MAADADDRGGVRGGSDESRVPGNAVNETVDAPPRGFARRSSPTWRRDALVVLLTVATGATDAFGFLRLGGVFTSVMTGNMVLLGVAAGRGDGTLALHTGVAFVCYVAGTIGGARIGGRGETTKAIWPRAVTLALILELAIFTAVTIVWEKPSPGLALALLGLDAVALGVQSAAVLRFGVSGLSTTYLTGTLTTVIASLSSAGKSRPPGRSVAVLVALVVGAALGAVFAVHQPRLAPIAILCPIALVIGAALASDWSAGAPAD